MWSTLKTMIQIRKGFDLISDYLKLLGTGSFRNKELEEELTMEAEDLILEAYQTKDPGNRTMNQHDAYYWVLYFNGEIIAVGSLPPEATIKSGMVEDEETGAVLPYSDDPYHYFGIDEAKKAIRAFTPPHKGYTLLIGNAMWYSVRQERGLKYSRDKYDTRYQVLSQTKSRLSALADKYNGIVTLINMTA